jgi:hypothetical protein
MALTSPFEESNDQAAATTGTFAQAGVSEGNPTDPAANPAPVESVDQSDAHPSPDRNSPAIDGGPVSKRYQPASARLTKNWRHVYYGGRHWYLAEDSTWRIWTGSAWRPVVVTGSAKNEASGEASANPAKAAHPSVGRTVAQQPTDQPAQDNPYTNDQGQHPAGQQTASPFDVLVPSLDETVDNPFRADSNLPVDAPPEDIASGFKPTNPDAVEGPTIAASLP